MFKSTSLYILPPFGLWPRHKYIVHTTQKNRPADVAFTPVFCYKSLPLLRVQQLISWVDGAHGKMLSQFGKKLAYSSLFVICTHTNTQTDQLTKFICFSPCPSPQMPGSSGTTQSMKKTIGHRGVETTTGETTYKKVRTGGWWGRRGVSDTVGFGHTHSIKQQRWKVERMFGVYILKLVCVFVSLDTQK